MTRFVGTPLRGIEFSSVSDEAVSTRVNGDGHPRIRIDAGGRITWSAGASAGDTNLYRDGENALTTDDVFKATGGLVTISTDGAPTVALPNGALAIDTTNHVFYFRSDNVWNQVTGGGGGASITISDTAPTSPEVGDLWFESDTGSTFVYYDSYWVEVGGIGLSASGDLDGLSDVTITSPSNGQVFKYNGTAWVNEADDGGLTLVKTQTIGSSVSSVTVTGAFSSEFDNYVITVSGGAMDSGDYGLNMYLGSTRSGYYYTGEYITYGNSTSWIGAANTSEWGAVGIATTNTLQANISVYGPNLAKNTYFSNTYIYGHPSGGRAAMGGYLADTTQYTSFTLFVNASSFTGGTIRVYGYRN